MARNNEDIEIVKSKLNQILDQRDMLFPKRDPQNTEAMRDAFTTYINTLRKTQKPNWEPNDTFVEKVSTLHENAVFICGEMKSGTTLILELLDNHPELIVIPGDAHMINLIRNPSLIYNKISDHSNSPYTNSLKDWDTYWVMRLINPLGIRPFWIFGDSEDPYREFLHYLNYWLETLPFSEHCPFLAVIFSYYCANPNRGDKPKMWIEKTPSNEHKVDQILDFFPSAKFIHTIRDPRHNIASLRRLYGVRKWNWDVKNVSFRIKKSIETGLMNQKKLGKERYHIVHYEDLIMNPNIELKRITSFLQIPFYENLLYPSVNGFPAKSNTMFQEREIQGGILAETRKNWQTEFKHQEQKIITSILSPVANKLGYK
ncbi:MAG: sulfotransferase [Candidatus Hermodarchaeota archaeon]